MKQFDTTRQERSMGVFIVMTALGFGAMALSGNPLYLVVGVVLGTILGLSKRKDGKP